MRGRRMPLMMAVAATAAALAIAAAPGCGRRSPDDESGQGEAGLASHPPGDSAVAMTAAPSPAPRYGRIFVSGPGTLTALQDSLGKNGFAEILKINRLDLKHVRQGDSLIVVGGPFDSLRFSPFPAEIGSAAQLGKLLLVSLRVQAFAAYEHGRLVRWGPTSTGRKETPTPARLYHTNWKDKERVSTFNEEWQLTWYVNLDNFLGISLHEYELPGRPASHSCVRLLEKDARWLYDWSESWTLTADGAGVVLQGTPVSVFGEYAFGRRPPWKRLPEDPDATSVSPDEIAQAVREVAVASTPVTNR